MKKFLLCSFLLPLLFSCGKSSSPKETAQAFLSALSTSDLTTTANLVSTDTKGILEKAKKDSPQTVKPEESFQFASLTENISDDKAAVKNDVISIPLVKEKEGWKVALNETLLNEVQGREEMLALVKTKWETLQKEYEARLQVLREYVDHKKSRGALSQKVELLNQAVTNISSMKVDSKENRATYVQKQQQLNNIIDAALEPTFAANSDLSLTYFVQITGAGDRIKAAEAEYQAAAQQAHSPVYAPLPVAAGSR